MKKVLSSIIVVVVIGAVFIAGLYIFSRVCLYEPFKGEEGIYYLSKKTEDSGYILVFGSKNTMSLYRYYKEPYNQTYYYYGAKTEYEYSGEYYTHLFWNLYLNPREQLLFWKQFAWFDSNEKRCAIIEMKPTGTTTLFAENVEPITGRFVEKVTVTEHGISIGELSFVFPETADDLMIVVEIIQDFVDYGEKIA